MHQLLSPLPPCAPPRCLYECLHTSRIKGADKLVLLAYHDWEPLEQVGRGPREGG